LNAVKKFFTGLMEKDHNPPNISFSFFKFIGPGLLVTVGFIDPGNWASNFAAGSQFGYQLLWVVTLSTIMLILLQHNVAHLGIVTGDCLAEAASKHIRKKFSVPILISGLLACVSTALAELLGGAIALNMLFRIPVKAASLIMFASVVAMLFTNSYKKIEKIIIGFVSVIGLSYLYELLLVPIDWGTAAKGWVVPSFPENSALVIMSVLGAVVMPHNLFLHSEIIQSRQFNQQDKSVLEEQLKNEFKDTLFSMIVGWAINSAMILLAAATFFQQKVTVTELSQAHELMAPLIGPASAAVFAIALLFAGFSSSITAGMTGGIITAGIFEEPYSIHDRHTKMGVLSTLILAVIIILFIQDPFQGLLISQMLLSIQLPVTIFLQLYLTSSGKVMGEYKNSRLNNILLWGTGILVTVLNIYLLADTIF
jgi:Mn2+ and Fe2+ transporters of the NRAMP family